MCIDVFSKFSFIFSLKSKDTPEKKFKKYIYYAGPPNILQCDNSKKFRNSELEKSIYMRSLIIQVKDVKNG